MGIPVDGYEYGEDCSIGIPTLWLAGQTPKYAHVTFNSIVKCWGYGTDPPNGRTFSLTQIPTMPCWWVLYTEDGWDVLWNLDTEASYLFCQKHTPEGLEVMFESNPPIACVLNFTNERYCPDFQYGEGTGIVSFTADPIPEALCETMGFHPGPSNLYHKTPTIDNLADYRLANRSDKTNVLCKVCIPIVGRENELLEFTGVLAPDSTGDFEEVCTYGVLPYYYNAGEGWFLWFDAINELWVVSVLLGVPGTAYWTSADKISTSYLPHGTASGIGNMHAPA